MRIVRLTGVVISAAVLALAAACSAGSTAPTGTAQPSTSPSASTPSQTPTTTPTPPVTTPPTTTSPTTTATPTGSARVVSSRIAYPWGWPGPMGDDTAVKHHQQVPPVPELVRIAVAEHAGTLTSGAYDRIAFTFTRGFPSSDFWYSDTLLTVGPGTVIPRRPGTTWLGISFMVAQAHNSAGHSSIVSQPPTTLVEHRIVGYVQAGDFEGGLNYGIAIAYPLHHGQVPVRVVEVVTVTGSGEHLYTVAFDFPLS